MVVGRRELVALVTSTVAAERWVTLTGPPGVGKSVLGRAVAAAHPAATWVDLEHVATTSAVVASCLDALRVTPAPGEDDAATLARVLEGTDRLLVLDGASVAHEGLGRVVEDLVARTTGTRVLVTALTTAESPLERVVRVDPLPVPGPEEPLSGPALDLLVARVEAGGGRPPDLPADEARVRRLIEASGGLPLVLTQLAAQIALLGVPNVAPAASPSHAVEQSYALLGDVEQRCFRRLALLGSPAGLDALAAVTEVDPADAAPIAGALARRHLVEVLPDGRFAMLAPIRAQAAGHATAADRARMPALLIDWAERVLPGDPHAGAADAPWLPDVPVVRAAVAAACSDPATRDQGYRLANRAFGSLYTAMRAREALEVLEIALASGDGPADVGAQLARRAGISASEVRGSYEGMRLLDRADEHARVARDPRLEQARTASIRAEMHLDAGELDAAAAEARRAVALGADGYATRQSRRTLMDVHVSRGEFAEAEALLPAILDDAPEPERWIGTAARILRARIAWEQGRVREAAAGARAVREDATADAEDRVALLADTLVRQVTGEPAALDVDREHLPWAVRIGVLLQDARDVLADGGCEEAAAAAAELVALADAGRLGRDAVDARLLLGDTLLRCGDPGQALSTYLEALRRAAECPLPLRAAEALDGLAVLLTRFGHPAGRPCAAAARALRTAHGAVRHPRPGIAFVAGAPRDPPAGWVSRGRLRAPALEAVAHAVATTTGSGEPHTPLSSLTAAQRTVAELVATGLTSRQIAEDLHLSPRTVDAHLAHIYRKLGISSRARLATLMADHG